MGDSGMAVNLGARVWTPFRELNDIVDSAVTKRQLGAVHDLEVALRRHKPDFISLLKVPAKNPAHRDAVRKASIDGLKIKGEQRIQTFSQQFIAEALILSDLFDLNELAAVELLMAGEVQLPNYPGLTRGLVAVLLFYDGQRSLVTALRSLAQARDGRTWAVGATPEVQALVNDCVGDLLDNGIVGTVLDLIKSMDLTKQLERLQKDRALGPPKHRKQVSDIYNEIRQTLGDIIFCLACQRPLSKRDTLRLIAHLRNEKSLNANESLDSVTLSLLVALWYCFDVSILLREDSEELLSQLPVFSDPSFLTELHQEMTSNQLWAMPGLKAATQFSWAVMLRLTSQFNVASAAGNGGDCFEDDERLIDLALEGNVFSFLSTAVVGSAHFHSEEFYYRELHALITDFIHQMPLKTKELRNRGDEMSRIIMAHQAEGQDPPAQRGDMCAFMTLIGDLYSKDPLGLQLSLEFWCPPEPVMGFGDSNPTFRPDAKQTALFKFIRVAGDLLPAPLFLPYIHMLTGLATGPQSAHHCYSLLRMNGGQANPVSWDHIFASMHQYYASLRQENTNLSESVAVSYRSASARSMTPQEHAALCKVLELTRHIADLNETCRSAFCENQQWAVVMVLFGLTSCSISVTLKAVLMRTLAAIAKTPAFAATIWQTLESSQILPTVGLPSDQSGGIRVELEEVESRNEEFPLTRGFLELLGSLTKFPVPMGLGAGTRASGFDPYLDFVVNSVLLKYNTRAYKMAAEKWQVVTGCLEIIVKLLKDYELAPEDLQKTKVDVPGVGLVPASKQPGFTILCLMLTDSQLFKTILQILEEAVNSFDKFTPFSGQVHLERASLLCLQLIEQAADRQAELKRRIRETTSPILISSLERLLLCINPRTSKADYLVNITKFVIFNASLSSHTLSAVRILGHVCEETPTQNDIVNLFTAEQRVSLELLQGFVECLDSSTSEIREERATVLIEDEEWSRSSVQVVNAICEQVLQLILVSLEQAAPNVAHWLLGFHLQKAVVKTTLQEPGVLDSAKTCLHSVLTILEQGLGSREGPTCLLDRPKLAQLAYRLLHALCANKDTSPPTLRYLRTTHDFLYRQLQHLPLDSARFGNDVTDHQMWLLKSVAIELRMTSLNRQRSHTQRLVRLLLGEEEQDLYGSVQPGEDGDVSVADRESMLSLSHNGMASGKQIRHRLLGALDTISFEQTHPSPFQFTFFDRKQIEQLVHSLECKTRDGVTYCDVKALRQILLTELANQQVPSVAGQRPHIMEEIQMLLEVVVEHNEMRECLHRKRRAFEAWRQVVEVLLCTVPQDLLSGERRQAVLFEFLQELLIKVLGEDVNLEATSQVSDALLTLMANLRHCFLGQAPHGTQAPLGASDTTASSSHPFWAGRGSSRTLFSTSLQIVLKGLIDYILKSSGGVQKVKVNLYGALLYCLQIARKPQQHGDAILDPVKPDGIDKILSQSDSEYDRLIQDNMETICSYGDSFMEVLCRDACDGHHVGRMLALSVLDTIVSMDTQNVWLNFLCSRGYLQHLLDSMPSEDDEPLLAVLAPQPSNLRALYIFQSKMSLLTRICQSPEGASILLHGGALERLASCTVLSLRPDLDDMSYSHMGEDEDEDELIPSPLSRYRLILFAVLRFCLSLLTCLGGENKEAATQVMLLVVSHHDVFSSILRSRKPLLNVSFLRELSLTTAVISRANYHIELGADLLQQDIANMEFRSQRMRLQDQMLALLPHYATPESLLKQLKSAALSPSSSSSSSSLVHHRSGKDRHAEVLALYQETACNLTAYCRSLIADIGASNLNQNLLFGPSLDEVTLQDGRRLEEIGVSLGIGRRLGLGVVLLLLQQSVSQFVSVLDSHRQLSQKLSSLSELTVEDLKQVCHDVHIEKMSSQQRQEIARGKLTTMLSHKSRLLQHYVYIVENGLYIIWRHLEFFLVHCVPADQSTMTTPSLMRHKAGIRKLTGAPESCLDSTVIGSPVIPSGLSQVALGVSQADITHLRTIAPSVIEETFFKKVQNVDQSYGKHLTHYSFVDVIIRRIRRVLKLHTGN